jgi:hypothetical protein
MTATISAPRGLRPWRFTRCRSGLA